MIQEEFVAYETAKLLRKSGFPQNVNECIKGYAEDTDSGVFMEDALWFSVENLDFLAAPTQAQAMRWLREEKNLIVEPRPSWPYDDKAMCIVMKWCVVVLAPYEQPTEEEEAIIINTLTYFPAYEAAAEAGIQAACNYLIEKKL